MGSIDYSSVIETLQKKIKEIMEKEEICGLAIALVDKNDIIWSEGFGFTDYKTKEKITADTLFSTQSMGKTITATCFMIMASKGMISLDDQLRKFYPEFDINTKFGDKNKEIEKITFRRMLGHQAGFTHEAPVGNNFDDNPCTMKEHIESINGTWLRSEVGTELAYSNLGYDLTAYVLSKIKKKSYSEVVKEELFKPLGIKVATLDITEALEHSFARGHTGEFERPTVQVPMLGAGGVYISVNEQAKFAMLHLNNGKINGKQLISKELYEEMYKPQFEEEGIKSPFGLGIYKEDEAFSHGGGGYGYLTQQTWMPKNEIAVIVFTNSMHHKSEQVKIGRKALELMHKEKTKPKVIKIESKKLKKLTGTYYRQRVNMQNIVLEENKLVCYDEYGKKTILYTQDELEFLTETGSKITFELDEHQKAKYLKWKNEKYFFKVKYNDSLDEQFGPNEKEWEKCVGIYQYLMYGTYYYAALGVFNGYLYYYNTTKMKLEKHAENHYFTADGESLEFKNNEVRFGNVSYTKIDLNFDDLLAEYKSNEHKKHTYKRPIMSLVGILYWKNGFKEAYEFLLKTIEANDFFKINLMTFGNLLYFYRDIKNAKICFEKLNAIDENNEKVEEMLERIDKELK
ncbi:MAG: beta-lactamase family protein [Asgard group archaeon]|nr:beta-lactamase family protein [Asgard group archaeon]